jgi:hypothetical protein
VQPGRWPLRHPRVPRGGRRRLDAPSPGRRRLPRGGRRPDAAARPGLEAPSPAGQDRRELDLHGGVLRRTWRTGDDATLRSLRFASLARPGVVGLRAEGPPGVLCAGPALLAPGNGVGFEEGRRGDIVWARTRSAGGGGITAAACQRTRDDRSRVERLAVFLADPDSAPAPAAAVERLRTVEVVGFDGCWPSTAPPGRPGGPTPRSPSPATRTPSAPSGSPCSTCWRPPPPGARRPWGRAG